MEKHGGISNTGIDWAAIAFGFGLRNKQKKKGFLLNEVYFKWDKRKLEQRKKIG